MSRGRSLHLLVTGGGPLSRCGGWEWAHGASVCLQRADSMCYNWHKSQSSVDLVI